MYYNDWTTSHTHTTWKLKVTLGYTHERTQHSSEADSSIGTQLLGTQVLKARLALFAVLHLFVHALVTVATSSD